MLQLQFVPTWDQVCRSKSHLQNAYKSSWVHVSRTEKRAKIPTGFLQTSQIYFENRADCKISLKKKDMLLMHRTYHSKKHEQEEMTAHHSPNNWGKASKNEGRERQHKKYHRVIRIIWRWNQEIKEVSTATEQIQEKVKHIEQHKGLFMLHSSWSIF